jgi:hypothetical protein
MLRYLPLLFLLLTGTLAAAITKRTGKEDERDRRQQKQQKARRLLDRHGVGKDLKAEIVGMVGGSMRRQDIVNHVRGHCPEKNKGELNDIVIASSLQAGRPIPKPSDTRAAEERARIQKERDFDNSKRRLAQNKLRR